MGHYVREERKEEIERLDPQVDVREVLPPPSVGVHPFIAFPLGPLEHRRVVDVDVHVAAHDDEVARASELDLHIVWLASTLSTFSHWSASACALACWLPR